MLAMLSPFAGAALRPRGIRPTRPQTSLTLYQTVTELLTAPFSARDLATIDLELNASEPDPGPSGPENGHEMASPRRLPGRIQLKLRKNAGAAL